MLVCNVPDIQKIIQTDIHLGALGVKQISNTSLQFDINIAYDHVYVICTYLYVGISVYLNFTQS